MKHQMDFAVAQRPLFSKKATMMTAISQNTWVVNNVTNLFLMYYELYSTLLCLMRFNSRFFKALFFRVSSNYSKIKVEMNLSNDP